MARFRIEYNDDGRRIIDIIDDSLTESEKIKIQYAIYKEINDSYRELLDHLPEEPKDKKDTDD